MVRTARNKVKGVNFFRAYGSAVEHNFDPEYLYAIGSPDKVKGNGWQKDGEAWHPIKPDLLRYDLAFVREDSTLVAFVHFKNGYGNGATVDRWKSHGFLLEAGPENGPVAVSRRNLPDRGATFGRVERCALESSGVRKGGRRRIQRPEGRASEPRP